MLTNDTDVDGDALTVDPGRRPRQRHASTLNADGTFTYTPTANFTGTDTFTYTATDGAVDSDTATVTITVTAVNDAPVADDDAYNTAERTAPSPCRAPGVLANDTDADGDTLTAVLVAGPANGTLTLNADGSFTYTPTPTSTAPTASPTAPTTAPPQQHRHRHHHRQHRTDGGRRAGPQHQRPTSANWTGRHHHLHLQRADRPQFDRRRMGRHRLANVVVRLTDNGPLDDDRVEVYNAANTARLPLGVVDLGRGDYVRATIGFGSVYFGATGTPSTMTISGNTVTIVLGTYSEQARPRQPTARERERWSGRRQRR